MVLCIDILTIPYNPPYLNWPTDLRNTKSVVVNNQIWFLQGIDSVDPSNQKYHVYFTIIDAETHGLATYDCETPCENGMTIHNLASDGHILYILLRQTETNYRLLKFDTKLMRFINNYVIETSSDICENFFVQGNYMHYKEFFVLKKIDLTDMSIKEEYEFVRANEMLDSSLMNINNRMYMVSTFGDTREVSLLDDRLVPQTISQVMWIDESWRHFHFTNGTLLQQDTDTNSLRNFLYTFDFDSLEWHREVDEDIQKVKHRMLVETVAKYEDRLYVFAANYVRVLDFQPQLRDICLTDIVKKMLADPSQAVEIMGALPLPQRAKVKRMVQFRMEEAVFNSIFN